MASIATESARAFHGLRVLLPVLAITLIPIRLHAQEPPIVSVAFCIDAAEYHNSIPSRIAEIERTLADDLATWYDDAPSFGYLKWKSGACESPAPNAAANLTINLVDAPNGDKKIQFKLGDTDLSTTNRDEFYHTLFEWFEDPHYHEPEVLLHKIRSRLKEQSQSDLFPQALAPTLQEIPLSYDIELGPAQKRLIVPLGYDDLKAKDEESEFRAKFNILDSGLTGNVRMILEGEYLVQGGKLLQCRTFEFRYGPHDFLNEIRVGENWSQVQDILGSENVENVRVYVAKYVPKHFLATSEGIDLGN